MASDIRKYPLLQCMAWGCCCYFTCSTMFTSMLFSYYNIGSHLLAQFQLHTVGCPNGQWYYVASIPQSQCMAWSCCCIACKLMFTNMLFSCFDSSIEWNLHTQFQFHSLFQWLIIEALLKCMAWGCCCCFTYKTRFTAMLLWCFNYITISFDHANFQNHSQSCYNFIGTNVSL